MSKIEVNKRATLTGHRDCIYTLEKGDTPNLFYSAGGDGMVVEWDLANPEAGVLIAQVKNSVYAVKLLQQNQLLIGQNFEGIHLVDIAEKKEIASSKITDSYIFDIQVYDQFIYVATGDGKVIILNRQDLSTIHKIQIAEKSIRCIAIHPKGKFLAVGCSDNCVKLFTIPGLKEIATLGGHENSVFTLAFDPEGIYLLSGGRDARLKCWDISGDFSLKSTIVAHMFAINNIAFSPDGCYFATGSMDKSVKIWNAKEFRLLKVIDKARHTGHGTSVNKLLWSSPNLLISAGDDRKIGVWEIKFNQDY